MLKEDAFLEVEKVLDDAVGDVFLEGGEVGNDAP